MDVTIIRDAEIASLAPERAGKRDRVVIYQAAPGVFGTIILPAETATEPSIVAAIKADVARRPALIGRTFAV